MLSRICGGKTVAALSIRNLDDSVKEKLRVRAALHGQSMEAEVRSILGEAVTPRHDPANLGLALMERFGALGGVELDLRERGPKPRSVGFST
jgi:plasmid stability protein